MIEKLQLKKGQQVRILGAPPDLRLGVKRTEDAEGALLVFAASRRDLKPNEPKIVESARADRLTWVAYPKAGQKGTDLNRDILARQLGANGIQTVRAISIDDVWSALRFRPKPGK